MIQTVTKFEPKNSKEERVLIHDRQLVSCRFSPDGTLLFAAGFDGKLHRWNLAELAKDDKVQNEDDPDEAKTKAKKVGDQPTEDKHRDSFTATGGWIESMAILPDGTKLLTADSWGQVRCWPVSSEKLEPIWTIADANQSWLRALTVSPDGSRFATCGNDYVIRVFSTSDGNRTAELKGHEHCVQSLAFHKDGNILVSGDQHGVVKHWDVESAKYVRDLDATKLFKVYYQYEQGGVRAMTFDTDYSTLYCAGFEGTNANQAQGIPTVLAFDWETGKQTLVMNPAESFRGPILDVAFHPSGYLIGAGSSEAGGVLWYWKPGEAKEYHMVKNVTSFRSIDLSADGLRLAATAFGDRGGQRGGNGRRLNKDGEYIGFAGNIVVYSFDEQPQAKS